MVEVLAEEVKHEKLPSISPFMINTGAYRPPVVTSWRLDELDVADETKLSKKQRTPEVR